MALAEARAAWQRTANRCLVQEDAKRAPKLACCPSVVTSPVKQSETETEIEIEIEPPSAHNNGQTDMPSTAPLPFNRTPSCSNLSPSSRWWLQMQPNYGYQKVLMEKQSSSSSSSVEGRNESCCIDPPQSLEEFAGCEVSKDAGEDAYFFDSESSWIGSGRKSTPWWRTADSEELALLVAQRSLDVLENCDLPRPQNSRVKKDTRRFSNDDNGALGSKLVQKPGVGILIAGDSNRDRVKSTEDQLVLDADISSSPDLLYAVEGDSTRARLLDALRHSQTRAREAEEVMKKTCAEKEYVVKLVLRQASQLFAYKQWVHLLQLENKCLQFKNSKNDEPAASTVFSPTKPLPWKGLGNRKTRKGWPLNRKRARRGRAWCDLGKYAIAYALGLGLVGAGFLLGWTVGLVLPTWCEM